ncbi:MAG: 4-alpha-glucanotransferase [Rubrobacteraceae bacterium]
MLAIIAGMFPSTRSSGVLLHPTSLPGAYGIGELGSEALSFVDFLENAGQSLWQILPLNPTDDGGSPYSSPSAFAGNPLLASTERLAKDGLVEEPQPEKDGLVNFASIVPKKMERLRMACSRWKPDEEFDEFREENRFWLDDYALFMAIKGKLEKPWNLWSKELATRRPDALKKARRELETDIFFHEFAQFRFLEDWRRVRKAANEAGISIIGDIPIFISHDSADVWSNRELFFLESDGSPSVVAGVPPDYFSETGQLWGNPLYRWERMREDGYAWWKSRIKHALSLCDALRLDHFRGFEAYWEVPADEETAVNGRWAEGPGEKLFAALRGSLGELPLIAEDLGDISPEVVKLRKDLGFPGMKVLQFGFSDPGNHFLPHNYEGANWVAYTGTHDNDTTAGWWRNAGEGERSLARRYLGKEYLGAGDFIQLAYSSTARWAVVPMQDLLGLGAEARMNTPGTVEGNWRWRMEENAFDSSLAARMRGMAEVYGRTVENEA